MLIFKMKYYKLILIVAVAALALAGCATQKAYFRIDSSLQKEIRNFNGIQYMPLDKLCNVYGLTCKRDDIINTAAIEKRSNRIVLRSGSRMILVNGEPKELDSPVVFMGGAIFVPVSFVRGHIGVMAGIVPREAAPPGPAPEVPKRFTIRTIVLDPGHGGKDAGALGRRYHLKEKDMALRLARKIKDILEGGGIKVIMTRSDDTFIPLERRAEIANHCGADLFVSVHLNASRSKFLKGFECYFLSNATDDNARALEAYENSSLKLGDGASAERSRELDKTLWDLTLTENRLESAELASHICDAVEQSLAISNRGVRSARFYVLKYTNMPAVLVEGGYISNRYEEMKIKDPNFLDRIAEAVAGGILKYKKEYENTEGFTKT